MGEKEERNHKRRKLQVHFTVCTFALYPSVHHKPICSELWLMMRGLWCCKGTELKLYNEQFHLNQVQSHLLIRSDPHMISGYFWSGCWRSAQSSSSSVKIVPHCSQPMFNGNEPWSIRSGVIFSRHRIESVFIMLNFGTAVEEKIFF